MKNLIRSAVLALTLTLLLGLASVGYAQEEEQPCFGLGEEDCALYYELSDSAELPLSSAFDLTINTDMAIDMPDEQDEISFGIFLNGAYVVDAEAAEAAVDEFDNTPVLDVSTRTFINLGRGLLGSFDAELELDYEFPEEAGVPPIGPFNVWLVDGVGYLDFTPLQMMGLVEDSGVYGVDPFDFIEVPMSQFVLGDLFADMDTMDGGGDFYFDPSEIFDEDGNIVIETDIDEEALAGFESGFNSANMDMEDLESFVTLERADDETVDGVDVAVFVTTVDLEAAMQVDAIVSQAYNSAVQNGMPADIDEDAFGEAMAEAMAGSVVTVAEKIDTETGIGMAVVVNADITVDVAPIAALSGDQVEGTIAMSIVTEFTRSDVNAVEEIVLPEGATEVPVESLLGGF